VLSRQLHPRRGGPGREDRIGKQGAVRSDLDARVRPEKRFGHLPIDAISHEQHHIPDIQRLLIEVVDHEAQEPVRRMPWHSPRVLESLPLFV
jgi:hypothetical protein